MQEKVTCLKMPKTPKSAIYSANLLLSNVKRQQLSSKKMLLLERKYRQNDCRQFTYSIER